MLLFAVHALIAISIATAQHHPLSQYLNIRSVSGASLSPDGTECLFLWNVTGTNQVWKVTESSVWPQQLTFFDDRISFASWSPKGNSILIGKDIGGNERTQLYLMTPDGSRIDTLTDKPDVIYGFGGWSDDGEMICFTSNERDQRYFDVYVMNVAQRERRLIYQQDGNNSASGFSPDGKWILVTRSESSYNSDIFGVEVATKTVVHLTPHEGSARYFPTAWTPDSKSLFILTDAGRDFVNVASIDLATKKLAYIHDMQHDVQGFSISEKGTFDVLSINDNGYTRIELRSRSANKRVPLPDSEKIRGVSFSRNEKKALIHYASATSIGEYFLYDVTTKKMRQILWPSYAGIPRESFIEPSLVSYASFDGMKIPGFLFLPKGAAKNASLACIVQFHGGPEGQSTPAFNTTTQYFLSRGYALFFPNIRGSTGYGKTFMNADNARKRSDAIEDAARAVEFLKSTGYIDPQKIIAMGGSYGGYMTLAQLTFHPKLWAAGIDIVGISNFESFLKNTGAWRARHRAAEYGDPEHDAEYLRSVSPLNFVDRISAPLLVIQGANDPRVPKSEADQIVKSVESKGGVVKYLLYPDEGHGLAKQKNRLTAYQAVIDFLDRYVRTK